MTDELDKQRLRGEHRAAIADRHERATRRARARREQDYERLLARRAEPAKRSR